jgi:hypothetical protein
MLSRLVAPVTNLLKSRPPQSLPEKGVPELLAALAEVRARKAQLEREEVEIIAATRARLREQQAALEDLRRKVQDCGIDGTEPVPVPSAPSVPAEQVPALRPSEQVLLSN